MWKKKTKGRETTNDRAHAHFSISEAYGELKERAKEVGLIINVEKTKAMVQSRRLGKGRTLTVEDHKTEVVRRFRYLGTVINDVNDKMKEIRARILAANNAYSSLLTIFRSKQIYRNKIRLYKTLIKPILCYGSVTCTLTQTSEQMLNTFERKILRRIYSPTHEGGCWRPRWNNELYSLYKEPNIVEDIKIRRLEWAGHIFCAIFSFQTCLASALTFVLRSKLRFHGTVLV